MKRVTLLTMLLVAIGLQMKAEGLLVKSPDGRLAVEVENVGGCVSYAVDYDEVRMIEPSALGVHANIGDFATGLTVKGHAVNVIKNTYKMRGTKASEVNYHANELSIDCENAKKQKMTIVFRVSNNDIAFRYTFPQQGETACMVVRGEATSFRLPTETTTFLSPQSDPMIGWKRTKPSYEEEYTPDAPMTAKSKYGRGYTFPCLFHVGDKGWVLVSETGTDGRYVGCRLLDYDAEKGYRIGFPMPGEANGIGTADAGLTLPGATPWRTITVGKTLQPVVETTVAYDVVEERYRPSCDYKKGRYTWSWLIWQDNSVNYEEQIKFIDLAAAMGYEYCLVDGLWDKQIGKPRIEQLSRYAQERGVELLLWYNSNGFENDAPQGPKNRMNTLIERRKEMAWMKSIGVKGIKVDFFGGDKQHTMQLYEDIMSDANDFGLQVIFHGCTLPRGWERMFPNFVASEAVLASENTFFQDHHAKQEGFELTMHPFCRNAVASMDWGGTIMNRMMSQDNKSRHPRYTTDVFEMAAAIVNQSSVQCIAMQPNNLTELPQFEIDFLKGVPTEWDETRFIDGYPGKYVVMARRSGDRWYVVGLNATKEDLKLELPLPMFAGREVDYYNDKKAEKGKMADSQLTKIKVNKKGIAKVVIRPNGGLIIM